MSTYYDPSSGLPARRPSRRPGQGVSFDSGATGSFTATSGQTYPGSIQVGGPNIQSYADILQSDPVYQQTLADLGASNIADRAGLKSARQRAVVSFGEVPSFSPLDQGAAGSDFGQDIDEATRLLAQTNTQEGLSVAARLNKQHADNIRTWTNFLSSRGLLRSGETGYRLGEEEQNYKIAQTDSREKLLQYLANYQQGYLGGIRQRQAAQAAAAGGAYTTQAMIHQNDPPPQEAGFVRVGPGGPIYGTDDSYYDKNGMPIIAPPTAGAPPMPTVQPLKPLPPLKPRRGEKTYSDSFTRYE